MKQFYNQTALDSLSARIEALGRKMSPDDCKELRSILGEIASLYHGIAEIYKMAEIHLIPSKLQETQYTPKDYGVIGTINKQTGEVKIENMKDGGPLFTPATKQHKGNPLAELLGNLSEADKAKLVGSLEQNLKKE